MTTNTNNTNATIITTAQLKGACVAFLTRAAQTGNAAQATANVVDVVSGQLGTAVEAHRVRYALQQLEAEGLVTTGKVGRAVAWALVGCDDAAEEARLEQAEREAELEDARRAAASEAAAEDALPQGAQLAAAIVAAVEEAVDVPTDAAVDAHVDASVEAAAADVAAATAEGMATELATVLNAARPAKKRGSKASKGQPKAKAERKPRKRSQASTEEREAASNAAAHEAALAAEAQATVLRAEGVEERIITRMQGSKGRKVAKLARLLGVPSCQRDGFKLVVAEMQADGRLAGDAKKVRLGMGAASAADPEAVARAIAELLGDGAAAAGDSVAVTGASLGVLAAALGLDPVTGAKARKVRATAAAGTWAMLAKGGVVRDSSTKGELGSWYQQDDGVFVARLDSGSVVDATSRSALRDAVNAALNAAQQADSAAA